MIKLTKVRLVSAVVALSLVIAACSGADATATPQPTQPPPPTATSAPAPTAAPAPTSAPAPTAAPTATPRPTATAAPTATPVPTATPRTLPEGELLVSLARLGNFEMIDHTGNQRPWLDSMYDYWIGADSNGRLDENSGVAKSWEVDSSGTVWSMEFRDGVVFHNGEKATAADGEFHLNWATREDSHYGNAARVTGDLVSVRTTGEFTLEFTLANTDIFWPHLNLSESSTGGVPSLLLSKSHIEALGFEEANKNPVGSGPYRFKSLAIGDKIEYEALDEHWFYGVPRIRDLTFQTIPEETTRIALLRAGGSDLVQITRNSIPQIESIERLTLYKRDVGATASLRMEEQFKESYEGYGPNPFNNETVRKALGWYAIDRQAMVDVFLNGAGVPTMNAPVSVKDLAYEQLPVPQYDPDRARAMLADAGYADGFEVDMLTYLHGTGLPETTEIMEAIAVWWEDVGITVNRIPSTFPLWLGILFGGEGFSKPTATGLLFVGITPVPVAGTYRNNHSSSPFSVDHDADLDAAAAAWASSTSLEDYISLGRAYQTQLTGRGCRGGAGCILFYAGDVFAGNSAIPDTWDLGSGAYSWNLENAAIIR